MYLSDISKTGKRQRMEYIIFGHFDIGRLVVLHLNFIFGQICKSVDIGASSCKSLIIPKLILI